MNNYGPWHTEDFDDLSWHDNHVHGFRLDNFSSEIGAADLILDIDHILKWEKAGSEFQFTVCPATLQFHEAFGLKLMLDYATPTIGMCAFSIDGIERVPLISPNGYRSFRWRIPINCPEGHLEFEAPRFTLALTGMPVTQSQQSLSSEKRRGLKTV